MSLLQLKIMYDVQIPSLYFYLMPYFDSIEIIFNKKFGKTFTAMLSTQKYGKIEGPTEIWTRIAGFKVQSANHYTMGPAIILIISNIIKGYKSSFQLTRRLRNNDQYFFFHWSSMKVLDRKLKLQGKSSWLFIDSRLDVWLIICSSKFVVL